MARWAVGVARGRSLHRHHGSVVHLEGIHVSMPRLWIAACALCFVPWRAEAHLVTTGLGPVYDGIGHLVLTPEAWVPIVALALCAGLRGAAAGRTVLFLFPVVWMAGGVLGLSAQSVPAVPIPAISLLIVGVLVASDVRLSPHVVVALAVGLGLVQGVLHGASVSATSGGLLELVGVVGTIFVVVALVAAWVVALKRPWTRVVVRVTGSWIAASGLFMCGWFLREYFS
jgi:hydrogenase/urease accessory protein HupE